MLKIRLPMMGNLRQSFSGLQFACPQCERSGQWGCALPALVDGMGQSFATGTIP